MATTHPPNPNLDENEYEYCTEKELEEIMLKKLELIYNKAIKNLMSLGYSEENVTKAILTKGYCHGDAKDVLTNIFNNTLSVLVRAGAGAGAEGSDEKKCFESLGEMYAFSLSCLVCLVKGNRPCLSRGDAIWCLLVCGLDVGRASAMEIDGNEDEDEDGEGEGEDECREEMLEGERKGVYYSGLSFRKNLLMRATVAAFAKEYRANVIRKGGVPEVGSGTGLARRDDSVEFLGFKNRLGTDMIMRKFDDMGIVQGEEFVPKDEKDEMILNLVHEIVGLEKQVKERKEWAHQKAMQAARKLCHDLMELKMLRTEKEVKRIWYERSNDKIPMTEKLSEVESLLRKASGQVDRKNLTVRRLEAENAEIRAEMEASRLSASESVTMCLAVAKREKKYLKKLLAWEKQKAKLQEDIAAEKQKLVELQDEMVKVEVTKKAAEKNWRKGQKAKDYAIAQVEQERRLKEATEANNKRNHESLRSKIEMDFQRYKDDLHRLEQELSQIKTSTYPNQQLTDPYFSDLQNETITTLLSELDVNDEKNHIDRACIFCQKDEVSVVFLPCAHQVLCGNCSDEYGKKGNAKCPTCRIVIKQRIRVFGASS